MGLILTLAAILLYGCLLYSIEKNNDSDEYKGHYHSIEEGDEWHNEQSL